MEMSTKDRINSLFLDGDNVIRIVNNEGGIVKLLGYPSDKCDLVDKFDINEFLKSGQYGKVFSVNIEGKNYAVKKADLDLIIEKKTKENIDNRLKIAGVSVKDLEDLQPERFLQNYRKAGPKDLVTVVIPPLPCIIRNELEYPARPSGVGKRCIIPKGSYLCNTEAFSEFVIGVYAGRLYKTNQCINFFDIFSLFTCKKNTNEAFIFKDEYQNPTKNESGNDYPYYSLQQYIFMEKISGDLNDDIECLSIHIFNKLPSHKRGHAMNSLYTQIVFAMAMYQEELKLSHNDLHTGNVFVEYITKNTVYNNQTLHDADWFHYHIKGRDIYIPWCLYIAKIGDFGLSVKYKSENGPMVGSKYIIEKGFQSTEEPEGLVPNLFLPSYDLLYCSYAYAHLLRSHSLSGGNDITPFVTKCIEYFCNMNPIGHTRDIVDRLNGNDGGRDPLIKINTGRPYLKKLVNLKTALDTLLGPIYKEFGEKPKQGKIVNCGELL